MESLLDKQIVLKLNSGWVRIGWATPRQAFIALCGGIDGGTRPAQALAITTDENGDLVDAVAMNWEEWQKLPIRDCDLAINTKNGAVRIPSVLICPEYSGMPIKGVSLTLEAIRKRDGDKCQLSGRTLLKGEGNLGHIIAKAKGGKRTWENLVYMDRRLNTLQGTMTPDEFGMPLLSVPRPVKPAPAAFHPADPKVPEQQPFI